MQTVSVDRDGIGEQTGEDPVSATSSFMLIGDLD